MGAQIHFLPEGPVVTNSHNQPVSVLTITLEDEYRLHQEQAAPDQNIATWLQQYPEAWAETGGLGLAKHRPALFVELKPGADPVQVRQYPMPLEAKKELPRISAGSLTRGSFAHVTHPGILHCCRYENLIVENTDLYKT